MTVDHHNLQQNDQLTFRARLNFVFEQAAYNRQFTEQGNRRIGIGAGVLHQTPDDDNLSVVRTHDAVRFTNCARSKRNGLSTDELELFRHITDRWVYVQNDVTLRTDLGCYIQRDTGKKRRQFRRVVNTQWLENWYSAERQIFLTHLDYCFLIVDGRDTRTRQHLNATLCL